MGTIHHLLLFGTCLSLYGTSRAQDVLLENFDDVELLFQNGWVRKNRSSTIGPLTWRQGGPLGAAALTGDSLSFLGNGYLAGSGTISDWVFTPPLLLMDGDVITFYALSQACVFYPDRFEVRMNEDEDTYVAYSATSVGDYAHLLLTVNEDLSFGGMPSVVAGDDWGWYSAVVTGLTAPVVARVAIRYFVEYGGADGTNSSYVGFDALRISRGTTPVGELQGNAPRIRFDPITGAVQLMDTCRVAGTALVTDALGRQLGWIPVDREGTMDLSAYPGGIYRLFLFDRCERANHSVQIMKL